MYMHRLRIAGAPSSSRLYVFNGMTSSFMHLHVMRRIGESAHHDTWLYRSCLTNVNPHMTIFSMWTESCALVLGVASVRMTLETRGA